MTTPNHAEVNIPLSGLYTSPQDLNKTVQATNRTKYLPRSINLATVADAAAPRITGQFEFQFNTSNNQWVDLFATRLMATYTTAAAGAGHSAFQQLMQNSIASAYLYLNGVQVAFTNNWSVASQINKRIQFSKTYNKDVHGVNYDSDVSLTTGVAAYGVGTSVASIASFNPGFPIAPDAAGIHTSVEYLDGFFVRDRDSCYVPPNTDIRMVFIADASGLAKSIRSAGAANSDTVVITSVELIVPSVTRSDASPTDYVLKLLTNQITTSDAVNDCNRTLTVDSNICKVAIAFQDVDIGVATTINKIYGGCQLAYANQNNRTTGTPIITGTAGTEQINTLQIQLGSVVQPVQAYNFGVNLYREAFDDYLVATNKIRSLEAEESFIDWLKEPIYLFNISRPVNDKASNLIVRGTRIAGAAAHLNMHIMEYDEQLVAFKYDQQTGACISTTTLK